MSPATPESFPRRVLLMVTGRSPQVVTETLYALCKGQTPPFVPTEVLLITTSEGAQDARLSLLSADPGWFGRLCRDWALPPIRFEEDGILVLPDAAGSPLADIRTRADNDQAADFIVDTVRRLTGDPTCALHVSLAGGRKTMGYYLGYALSLYGRPQDRLSHVLVSAPFESNRDFYYPTPASRVIYTFGATPQQQRERRASRWIDCRSFAPLTTYHRLPCPISVSAFVVDEHGHFSRRHARAFNSAPRRGINGWR